MSGANRSLHRDHHMDPELVAYAIERLGQARVPRPDAVPPESALPLPDSLPETGIGERAALEAIAGPVLDGAAQLFHPGYFAHMDPPTATVTWLAAMWQAATNQNLLHPDAGPAAREVERLLVAWLAPSFGMQGGHLVPGSTVANFTALWAARELRGIRRVLASNRAHLSVRKAADILGLTFEVVDSDPAHRMSLLGRTDLRDAAVVLTAGTVATGAIDDLANVSGAGWVHVDAAWGGPLRLSRRYASLLDGVAAADSVGFSAHKWCYQPKGTAVVLFREADTAHEVMSYGGGYLAAPNVGFLGSAPATAVPFATTLLAWGRAGLAQRIEAGMGAATALARRIEADSRFELWNEPTTGVVVWRPVAQPAAQVRAHLSDAWVSLTDLDGETWLRSVAANPSADADLVIEQVVAALAG